MKNKGKIIIGLLAIIIATITNIKEVHAEGTAITTSRTELAMIAVTIVSLRLTTSPIAVVKLDIVHTPFLSILL